MSKPATDGLYRGKAREEGFTFPLPMSVEGIDVSGSPFKEDTTLSFISHEGSSFYLKNAVSIGTKLKLTIDLPKKLSEDDDLKLVIKGRVVSIELDERQNSRKRVSIKFESKYIITPDVKNMKK